jgi:hypothetical protein
MQKKFLIVSNARAGSTWLETMLGALPDVAVDYEFKWRPKGYEPAAVHMVIPDEFFSCSHALTGINPGVPVVGSKLVLDPVGHTAAEYRAIRQTIGSDIKVIHLSRSLAEVFYSWCRGVYHVADAGRRDQWPNGRPPRQVLDAIDSLTTRQPDYLNQLQTAAGHRVEPVYCHRDVGVLLAHEEWMAALRRTHPHYVLVDYHDIPTAFPALARYVGSAATDAEVADVLRRPPTKKIPAPRFEDYFANAAELLAVCEQYEARRLALRTLPAAA